MFGGKERFEGIESVEAVEVGGSGVSFFFGEGRERLGGVGDVSVVMGKLGGLGMNWRSVVLACLLMVPAWWNVTKVTVDLERGVGAMLEGGDVLSLESRGYKDGSREVDEYRQRDGRTLFFWHPMKTGGTSLCFQAVRAGEFSSSFQQNFGVPNLKNNCKYYANELAVLKNHSSLSTYLNQKPGCSSKFATHQGPIQEPGISAVREFTGRGFLAFEPSFPPGGCWLEYNPTSLLGVQG